MPHRIRAALLAALLSLLTAAPALAQGFPATMGPNTVYGRLGIGPGPGQALTFAQLRTALAIGLPGSGTVTSIGCGTGLSGGTVTTSGSCNVIFGTASNTAAQGNDPRITGAAQAANNLSDLASAATARGNLGLGTIATQSAAALNVSGVTALTGLPACAGSTDACPKSYIDLLAAGFRTLPEVRLASAAVLPNTPTYANGTAGVGATLTAGANAALVVDGITVSASDAILVKDQVSTTGCTVANAGCQNGIYTVTTVGDGSNAWVLTRRTDFDTAAEMLSGSLVLATAGATNSGKTYNLQSTVATVGTTPATFNLLFINGVQWSASGSDAFRSTGNLGLSAAPSSWGTLFRVLQVGSASFGEVTSTHAAAVLSNVYWDGSNYKYINSTTAGLLSINGTSGCFEWYTAPSGTAGNSATVTRRAALCNTGIYTLDAYGAGVATFSSAGVISSKPASTKSKVYAADYSVIADGSTSNNTPLQNAIDACSTFPATGKGCILEMPCGKINVSTGFTIPHGMIMQGCGAGTARIPPDGSPTADVGGTVIVQSCTTCTTLQFTTVDAITLRDFGIDAPLNATTGSLIYIRPAASTTDRQRNDHSQIYNLDLTGGYNQLTCEFCRGYSIHDNVFKSSANHQLVLTNPAGTAFESGDSSVYANYFWVLIDAPSGSQNYFPTGGDCIYLNPQSGLKIWGNKFLVCQHAIHLVTNATGGGGVQIFGNNFEEMQLFTILVEQASAGQTYGFIKINDNHFQNVGPTTYAGAIGLIAGAAQYLTHVNISNNHISIQRGVSGTRCMFINDGSNVEVSGNECDMNGVAAHGGITVAGNATGAALRDNRIVNIASGQKQYDLSVSTKIHDLYGMTLANFPSNVGPGSTIYITDGKSTNIAAGNFVVTSGGSGCVTWVNSVPTATCVAP